MAEKLTRLATEAFQPKRPTPVGQDEGTSGLQPSASRMGTRTNVPCIPAGCWLAMIWKVMSSMHSTKPSPSTLSEARKVRTFSPLSGDQAGDKSLDEKPLLMRVCS